VETFRKRLSLSALLNGRVGGRIRHRGPSDLSSGRPDFSKTYDAFEKRLQQHLAPRGGKPHRKYHFRCAMSTVIWKIFYLGFLPARRFSICTVRSATSFSII